MYDVLILNLTILFGLIFGSYVDLKKREVPDFLSYFLISIGLVFAIINAIYFKSFWPIVFSLSGLLFCFVFGAIMFYTGQWGGGDAKVLMGVGTIIGLSYKEVFSFVSFPLLFTIIITFLFAGSVYGIIYVLVIFFKNYKIVKEELKIKFSEKSTIIIQIVAFLFALLFIFISRFVQIELFKQFFVIFGFAIIFLTELFYIIKVVEKKCMIKIVDVKTITEGEWIVDDVYHKGKYVCGPKDLGISEEQIELLKKHKINKIKIKVGIPFIPGFLLGFIIILIFGNWISQIIFNALI